MFDWGRGPALAERSRRSVGLRLLTDVSRSTPDGPTEEEEDGRCSLTTGTAARQSGVLAATMVAPPHDQNGSWHRVATVLPCGNCASRFSMGARPCVSWI